MASVTNMDHSQMNFQAPVGRNRNRDRKSDGKFKSSKCQSLITLSMQSKCEKENVKLRLKMESGGELSESLKRFEWCADGIKINI